MIFYKDFEWRQRKTLIDNLPMPNNCPYCEGSAYLYGETMSFWSSRAFICCQDKKFDGCLYNHYDGLNIKEVIELWNNGVDQNHE